MNADESLGKPGFFIPLLDVEFISNIIHLNNKSIENWNFFLGARNRLSMIDN